LANPAAVSHALKISHGFLYDRLSRPIFGKFQAGDDIQIDTVPLRVGGYVDIGADIVNDGNIQVAVKREAKCSGDRRGSHHQQMWIVAFADELFPLAHAEFVLFIDNDQTQVFYVEASLDQGVSANH